MNCPSCNHKDAYIGFNTIECANSSCKHFDPSLAKTSNGILGDIEFIFDGLPIKPLTPSYSITFPVPAPAVPSGSSVPTTQTNPVNPVPNPPAGAAIATPKTQYMTLYMNGHYYVQIAAGYQCAYCGDKQTGTLGVNIARCPALISGGGSGPAPVAATVVVTLEDYIQKYGALVHDHQFSLRVVANGTKYFICALCYNRYKSTTDVKRAIGYCAPSGSSASNSSNLTP